MASIELTEGWTGGIDLQCQADGAAYNLTGAEIVFLKVSACGVETCTTCGLYLEHVSSTCGILRWTPDSTTALRSQDSPYTIKVRVTSGTTRVYFPNAAGDVWTVYPQ